jgi:hypothetical protein
MIGPRAPATIMRKAGQTQAPLQLLQGMSILGQSCPMGNATEAVLAITRAALG